MWNRLKQFFTIPTEPREILDMNLRGVKMLGKEDYDYS